MNEHEKWKDPHGRSISKKITDTSDFLTRGTEQQRLQTFVINHSIEVTKDGKPYCVIQAATDEACRDIQNTLTAPPPPAQTVDVDLPEYNGDIATAIVTDTEIGQYIAANWGSSGECFKELYDVILKTIKLSLKKKE